MLFIIRMIAYILFWNIAFLIKYRPCVSLKQK
jgi:hypothetical protein